METPKQDSYNSKNVSITTTRNNNYYTFFGVRDRWQYRYVFTIIDSKHTKRLSFLSTRKFPKFFISIHMIKYNNKRYQPTIYIVHDNDSGRVNDASSSHVERASGQSSAPTYTQRCLFTNRRVTWLGNEMFLLYCGNRGVV